VHEFKLIETKELAPLKDLIDSLMGREGAAAGTTPAATEAKEQPKAEAATPASPPAAT
jgi:hypothetical protein